MVMGMQSVARSSVAEERDLFVSLLLSGARAQAIANVKETAHGIHIDNINKEYVLFEGTTYTPGSASNRMTPFTNDELTITNGSGENDIIFEPLSGNVSTGAGTITIEGYGVRSTIAINEVGQINW
jgi:hypothetical protein